MSVNYYNKETGELIQIAGNGGGSIDDTNVSNKTTYSSEKIENSLDKKTDKENVPFKFGITADGKYGYYKAGADSVTPFKSAGLLDILAQVHHI